MSWLTLEQQLTEIGPNLAPLEATKQFRRICSIGNRYYNKEASRTPSDKPVEAAKSASKGNTSSRLLAFKIENNCSSETVYVLKTDLLCSQGGGDL